MVQNMTSPNGNKVANQFTIFTPDATFFQSYDTVIVKTSFEDGTRIVTLDKDNYNYSKTTAKYRNLFLGCDTKTVEARIKSGEYRLDDLNK